MRKPPCFHAIPVERILIIFFRHIVSDEFSGIHGSIFDISDVFCNDICKDAAVSRAGEEGKEGLMQ